MGTTSQKLTYLNDTKTQLKDMINYGLDTGEKITSETTFRNYVKSLFDAFIKTMTYPDVLYNNLPKVTGEGTSLSLNDTVYAPMRVELSPSELEQGTNPSPDNPQQIHTVSGENTIKIKNSDNTQEQTYPISLGDLEYCKIGDYEDEFYKATESDTGLTAGKWYLKKNTIKRIFDGSVDEGWGAYLEYTNVARVYTTVYKDMIVKSDGYCNYLPLVKTYNADVISFSITPIEVKVIIIKLPISILSTRDVNGVKDWLSAHPTTIYYQLATPTYTLLSDTLQTQLDNIQKAISYQEQTNVSQTNNDLPFVIKLSAIRDLSGIFELIQG